MSRNRRFSILLSLGSCFLSAAAARAADLRSAVDDRTVVRTVSIEQELDTIAEPQSDIDSSPSFVPMEDFSGECGCAPACGCASCGPSDQVWAGVEYLTWWRSGRYFPALVTTNPNSGVLPNATVLFGDGRVEEVGRPGGRLEVGLWFDQSHCLGIGGHVMALADSPVTLSLTSNDLPFFARPFFDASTGNTPTAQVISNVTTATNLTSTTGQLDLKSGSEVQAADVFVRWLLLRGCVSRLDLIGGYQFARINENLFIDTATHTQPSGLPSITVHDAFITTNEYNAGHMGLMGEYRWGCWGLELLAKLAFGDMRQVVSIDGSTTTVAANGTSASRASGLLAQSATNGGVHSQDAFSLMEDIGVKLAFFPNDRLKLSGGYSLMYWSSVVRPGNEVDLSVDSRLFAAGSTTAATHPAFAFDPTHFLVHGLNFGMELRF